MIGRRPGMVYALMDPRNHKPRYVGVTLQHPTKRLGQHIAAGRANAHLPVARWINSLLRDGVEPAMVWISKYEPLDRDPYESEAELIERFRGFGHDLLNLTPGGRGGGLGPKSAQHRANISAGLKGKPAPPRTAEWRASHSAKMTGKKHGAETRERMREAQRRRRVLVTKTCECGAEYKVIPSRVDRNVYCGADCPKKAEIRRRGELANARITQDIADQIREKYQRGGVTQVELAAEFGTSKTNVGYILSGRTWRRSSNG
jgi:ribosome-binding protein aMBF1 (putative translation factor)